MKTVRRLAFVLAAGCLWAASDGVLAAEGQDLEGAVMAVVNNDLVTRKEVMERAGPMLKSIAAEKLPAADYARYEESIVNDIRRRIIEERLLIDEGRRLANANEVFKKRVDERVQIRIEEDARKAGGEVVLRDYVRARGMSWQQFVDKMTSDMMRDVVIYQFVTRDLTVGPEEIKEYYDRNPGAFTVPERVKFRQVFFRFGRLEERKETHDRAMKVLEEARKGKDFAALAREYSDDPRDSGGGLWDVVRGARPAPVDEKLFSAPIGEPTDPIALERGFVILRVESRTAAEVKPFDDVQAIIEMKLLGERRQSRYNTLIDRLWRQGYVEIMK